MKKPAMLANPKRRSGRKTFLFGFAFFLMVSGLQNCSSDTYREIFVSPEGDDRASGGQADPVVSLQRAAELARGKSGMKPVNIWLADGVYRLTSPLALGMADGGASGALVSWKAMAEANPIISGGIEVKDWQEEDIGLWSAPLPDAVNTHFRSFYVNGRRAVRSRFPNEGFLRISQGGEDDRTNFFFRQNEFPRVKMANELELILLHDWSVSRVNVREIDWEKSQLFTADTIGALSPSFFTLTHWEEHPRYFLENAREFLDHPGEWFCDADQRNIYYVPLPGERIEKMEAVIPVASKLLTVTGDQNSHTATGFITFEGITFEHTSWPLPPGGYCGIQACMFDNRTGSGNGWNKVPAAIELDLVENIRFQNCVVRHTGGSGIWIRENSKNCSIEACHIFDISGNGVNIGEGRDRQVNGLPWWKSVPEQVSRDNKISHCLIEDCGRQFYGAVGIWGGLVSRTTIDHNEVRELPYTGVSIGWMWDTIPTPSRENIITNNHIHHIMNVLSDGGGIYMLGLQPGSRISGNLIHHVSINAGRAESNGMFLDEGIKNVVVEENIIYETARSPLRFHRASTNLVQNNVLACPDSIPPIRYNRTREEDIQQLGNTVLMSSIPSDNAHLQSIIQEKISNIGPEQTFATDN